MDRPRDAERPLDAMCADIRERYHAALHAALPRIRDRLAAVAVEHPSPAACDLQASFAALADQIRAHLAKEENLLFPAIEALAAAERAGTGTPSLAFTTVLHPIRMMEAEHLRIATGLELVNTCAANMTGPGSQFPGWRAFLAELAVLEAGLREQHGIEDRLLFPRALDLERRLLPLG